MTWSTAGIQTGTDTDLTGLTSVTGVTSATDGNLTIYTVPSTVTNALRIQGTLSHNTELERIVFQRAINNHSSSQPYIWIDGGTYNFGTEKVPGVFTDGVGIQCNGAGSIWFNGGFNAGSTSVNGTMMTVGNNTAPSGGQLGGTLNINGGRISGQFNTTMRPNGVVSNVYNAKYVVDSSNQAAGQEWLSRFYGGTFNTTNFAYEGGSISLGNGFQGSTIGFDRTGAGVAYWKQYDTAGDYDPSDGDTYATIRNATFSGNVVDVAVRCIDNDETRAIRIQNCGNGSRVNVNGGETNANDVNNAGYAWITKQVDTNFTSLADGSNAIGRVFVFDTDRQSNIQSPAPTVATGAITYIGDFNGALTNWTASGTGVGPTSINFEDENEIALAFFSKLRDGSGYARGTIDTGDWAWDRRSDGGVIGVDDFTFQAWSYENQFFEASQDLAGTGILTVANAFNPDNQVTNSRAIAGVVTGVVLSADNSTITMNSSYTLDRIYDSAKLQKETTDANNVSQATTRDWVLNASNGSNIVGLASNKTLVSGSTITGGVTNNTLKVDGTLTLNAGGNLNSLTLDRSGATGATTVQGLDTVVYTPNSSGALTISGAVEDSMVPVNGTLTINGTATNSTLTPTGAATVSAAISGGSLSGSSITFSTTDGTSNSATFSSSGNITLNAGATYTDTTFTSGVLDVNGAYSSGTTTGATLVNVDTTGVSVVRDVANTTNSVIDQLSGATVNIIRGTTHTGSTFSAGNTFSPKFDIGFTGCAIAGTFQNQNINRILFTDCDITGTIGFNVVSASTGNNQGQVITGGTFSGTLTGTGGDTLTMTDVNVTGITLGTTGGTITPSGTTQLDILQAAATASAGTWIINAPVTIINNTWTIPTPSSGRYAVTRIIGGVESVAVAPTDFAAGAVISGTITDDVTDPFTFSTNDSIMIYVKYDSVFTAGAIQYYLENSQRFNFSATQGASHTFGVGAAAVADFAISEQADVPSNVSFTASADGNNTLVEITNSSNASLTLTFNTSLQLIANIANSTAYFDAWFANRGTTTLPIVSYGQGYVANIDAGRITFQSGNLDGTFRLQHTTGNWSNAGADGTIFANSRTGAPEVVSVIAGLALVNPTDLRNALDTSTTAAKVSDIENVAGYLVDENSLGPLVNQYEQTTDYTGNI